MPKEPIEAEDNLTNAVPDAPLLRFQTDVTHKRLLIVGRSPRYSDLVEISEESADSSAYRERGHNLYTDVSATVSPRCVTF